MIPCEALRVPLPYLVTMYKPYCLSLIPILRYGRDPMIVKHYPYHCLLWKILVALHKFPDVILG